MILRVLAKSSYFRKSSGDIDLDITSSSNFSTTQFYLYDSNDNQIDIIDENNVEFDFSGLGNGLINSTKMIYHWKNGLKLIKELGCKLNIIVET